MKRRISKRKVKRSKRRRKKRIKKKKSLKINLITSKYREIRKRRLQEEEEVLKIN